MKTVDVNGFRVQHQAVIFGKVYYFCIDVDGVYFMVKFNDDGTMEVL
jgi:hypothetical protein